MDQSILQDYKRQHVNTLTLENTRILYDGISRLRRQISCEALDDGLHDPHANICGMEEIRLEVSKQASEILKNCFDENLTPLYLNPNINFCFFWKLFFEDESPGKPVAEAIDTNKVGDMILYYDLIQRLVERNVKLDDTAYCYENLCWYICNVMECDMSYFVQADECNVPRIICRSGYDFDELKERASPMGLEFEPLIPRKQKQRDATENDDASVYNITEDIWMVGVKEEAASGYDKQHPEKRYVVIRLDSKRGLYLLLQFNAPPYPYSDKNLCKKLTRILFLREDLTQCLRSDFEYLLNIRFDCSFVCYFDRMRNHGARCPTIMHIADLHADEVAKSAQADILAHFNAYYDTHSRDKIDLLVLSGDIAEGKQANASQLQRNYRIAEDILLEIVKELWSRDDGRICFDWKRRIVCVPGNHDFAAMNLVKAALRQRSLAAGLPHDGENEIVAKFAYYLDFAVQFLDAPIDEMIFNNINAVREYRNMGAKILQLNSSWGASASRTNKVCLDIKTARRLAAGKMWNDCEHMRYAYRICVVHHPPEYIIDYTLDGYDIPPKWDWTASSTSEPAPGTINRVYSAFHKMLLQETRPSQAPCSHRDTAIMNARVKFIEAYEEYTASSIAKINREADRHNKTYFTKDAQTEYDYFKKFGTDADRGEEYHRLCHRAQFNEKVGAEDAATYRACLQELFHDTSINLILSGHVHAESDVHNIDCAQYINLADQDDFKRISVIGGKFIKYDDDNVEQVSKVFIQTIYAERDNEGKMKKIKIC